MTDPEPEPDAEQRREVIRNAAAGGWAAITDAILQSIGADPLTSAIAGTGIGLAYALDQATGRRREQRLGRLIEDVAAQVGGPDQLAAKVLDTDETAELTRRILEAAARTTLEDKLRALGRVLANALNGIDTIDDALILADALRDVEAPHIRALALIDNWGKPNPPQTPPMQVTRSGMPIGQLRGQLRGKDGALEAVTATLERHGLIRDIAIGQGTGFGDVRYLVTQVGTSLLEQLADAAE
jgi:hypothetical protein